MKLLIVDDETKTGDYLQQGLTEAGFAVDLVRDGPQGVRLARLRDYDLILLDVMLPGMGGWDVLRAIREGGNSVPVLLLANRDHAGERAKGLALGANGCLVKPFAFSELLVRVRTLLMRGSAAEQEVLRVLDLELDLPRRRAARAGRPIELTAKEFALLELLVRRRGEVLPRSLIASEVWDMESDSDPAVVDLAVRRLRAKIDDDYETKLIATVRGMGYVLDVPLPARPESGAPAAVADAATGSALP